MITFIVAVILTVIGGRHCDHKVVPLIRVALWFPLPYLLRANELIGVVLAMIQFPLLACVFAFAIRRWQERWVLVAFLAVYALYAGIVIAILGPPR